MQYLSKAYNYYSGINPATLSGAIDVIVVRHVDQDGTETLSSSPFHVRFGKLQVLRAGEKRVTIKLPNNLPSPHVAPFSMKVGETGEAFFVLETEDEVPPDLLTSPVVMPAEGETEFSPPSSPIDGSSTDTPDEPHTYITNEPFGDTEKQVHKRKKDALDADVLDLNESVETLRKAPATLANGAATPSSLLQKLPSIPFLSSGSSSSNSSPEKQKSTGNAVDHTDPEHPSSKAADADQPPNPTAADPGDSIELPARDKKLKDTEPDEIPVVDAKQAKGPSVVYGKDVVLDMAGYHSHGADESSTADPSPHHSRPPTPPMPVVDSLVLTLTRDLETSAHFLTGTDRPLMPPHRATDPPTTITDDDSSSDGISEPDIGGLSLDEPTDRHIRATSEPLETPSRAAPRTPSRKPRPLSPVLSRTPNGTIFPHTTHGSPNSTAMDLAWDWSKLPPRDDASVLSAPAPIDAHSPEGRADGSGPSGLRLGGKLKNVEENPHLFVLEMAPDRSHTFELSLCGNTMFAPRGEASHEEEGAFLQNRITFQQFIEDPQIVDDPNLVLRYSLLYLSWTTGYDLLYALSMYRRGLTPPTNAANTHTLPPLVDLGIEPSMPPRTTGYGWSRWWRRGQSSETSTQPPQPPPQVNTDKKDLAGQAVGGGEDAAVATEKAGVVGEPKSDGEGVKHYAKTLRLSSDQLKQLNLHKGANTIRFSVTSSYSGEAVCTARLFLWESTDQVVISDIDGTITKSDALGHVFAAIGRDWTHLGIARLYTDIANNGYKMLYLTSRAIGQADSTREYLRTINQGDYRMPEGPVIMSPDRLMASLHREVIMRKPELFKMACLRDIQRLFGPEAKAAFYAGFGNRITDAMSYRSVGVAPSKIYTIDSTGVVKTELLQTAGHKGSYILLNDLVNEVFPPVQKKVKPEYTDFNYWRVDIPDIPIPDLSPPSPALSARSDSSMSVLSKIIGRRSSKPVLPTDTSHVEPSSRPSSPLIGPAMTPDYTSDEEEGFAPDGYSHSRRSSMPGSYDSGEEDGFGDGEGQGEADDLEAGLRRRGGGYGRGGKTGRDQGQGEDEDGDGEGEEEMMQDDFDDDDDIFDDDILATGEMRNVPF